MKFPVRKGIGLFISVRVVLAFAFILVICLSLILLIRSNMLRESSEKNLAIARSIKTAVEQYLDEPLDILQETRTFLLEISPDLAGNRTKFERKLEEHLKPFRFIQSVTVIGKNGMEKFFSPEDDRNEYTDKSRSSLYLEPLRTGRPFWSPVFLSPKTGNVSVAVSRPADEGVLVAYLDLAELRDKMKGLAGSGKGFAAIVDRNGNYVSHPDGKLVEQRDNDRGFLDHRELAGADTGNFNAFYRNERYLVTALPLGNVDWTVLVYTPFSEVYGLASKAQLLILFAIGIALILAFVFTGQIVRTITAIFDMFIHQMTAVANGNYAMQMKPEKLYEFNELARQFNRMALEIQSREKVILFSQNRYRSLFENASVPILEIDLSGIAKAIEDLNARGPVEYRKYFLDNPDEVLKCLGTVRITDRNREAMKFLGDGQNNPPDIMDKGILTQGSLESLTNMLVLISKGLTNFEAETPVIDGFGKRRYLLVHASVVPGYERSLARVLVSTVDITEKKISENETERSNRDLKELVENAVKELRHKDQMMLYQSRLASMGEMLRNISHQWRQPLNALGINIQNLSLALSKGVLNGEYLREFTGRTMNLILHMSKTIDDFRNFFRPDKEPDDFNVRETVERTLSIIEASLKNNFIGVKTVYLSEVIIKGYPNEYSQVLLVILNNAKDVLVERNVPDPEVTITLRQENGRSVVTVSDNGGGVENAIIQRIFDPYFTTKSEGTGIGLYMSKLIIEKNMGGRLTVSNTGAGAEFRIEI